MTLTAHRNIEGRLALEWGRLDDGRRYLGVVVPGWMAYLLVGREAGHAGR